MIVLAGPMAMDKMKAPNYQITSVPSFKEPKNYVEELAMKAADSSIDALVKDEDIGAKATLKNLRDMYTRYKYDDEEDINPADMTYYKNRGMMLEEDDSIVKLAAENIDAPKLEMPDYKVDAPNQSSKGGGSNFAKDMAMKIGMKMAMSAMGIPPIFNKGGLAPKYAEHGAMTDKEKRKMLEDNKYFSFMQGYPLFMFPFETAVDAGTSLLLGGGGNPFLKTKKEPADPFAGKPVEVIEAPDPNTLRMMMKKKDIMPDDVINPRDVPMVEGEFYYGPMSNNYNKGKEKVKPKDGIVLAQSSSSIGPGDSYFRKYGLNPQMYRDYYDKVDEFARLYRVGPMAKSGSMPIQRDVGDGFSFIIPSETNEGSLKSNKSNAYEYSGRMKVVDPIPQKVYDSWIGYDEDKIDRDRRNILNNIKVLEANEGTMDTKRKGILAGDGKYDYDKDRSKLLPFSLSQDILFPAYDYFIKKYIYPDYERTVPTVLDFDKAKSGLERMKYGEPIPEFIEMPDGKILVIF